jgi:AraC family transcriptional activator of pobA
VGAQVGGGSVAGPRLYDLGARNGGSRVNVERFNRAHERARAGAHGHRVLELLYFDRSGGRHRVGDRSWEISAGDLFLVSPGEVHDVSGIGEASGWAVEFPADVLAEPGGDVALLSWRSNPLLHPFVRPVGGELTCRFAVPEAHRAAWSWRLEALADEVTVPRLGHREAVRAHLTVLLVDVARLAHVAVGHLHAWNDPVLQQVFAFIEEHYAEPISLREVAAAVHLSPGHVTTLIGRRTGRTVVGWIAERRMAEARRLLAETDDSAEAVGARVGYGDPAYFSRRFRAAHGTTPAAWRRVHRWS